MRIELSNVTKWFGTTCALSDVNGTLASGARVALIGPNGSGKSTLMRAILGLVSCDGDVRVDGRDAFRERAALAPHVAYVPQIAPRLSAPVRELIAALCSVRGLDPQAVTEAGALLNLDIPSVQGKPFHQLSGGMKQKILLALAMSAPARLFVLDEPTASLDAASRARFFQHFRQAMGSATVVLCTHRPDEVGALADQALALDEGKVRYLGPITGLEESELALCLSADDGPAMSSLRRPHSGELEVTQRPRGGIQ